MKAILALIICLILSWHLSAGVLASADNPDAKERAQKLLDLSDKQNSINHDLAVQTAQKALAIFQSINDQEGMGNSYQTLGRYYYALNKMDEATQNFEMSLQIWRQLQDPIKEAGALTQLGYIEGRGGEWLKGFSHVIQAQNLLNDTDDWGAKAGIAAGMGFFFNESGLPKNGLTQYQRAEEFYSHLPNKRAYNRQIMLVGYTYFLLRNYSEAMSHLQQALANFKSSGDKDAGIDSAECEEYIGQIFLANNQFDLALQSFQPIPAVYDRRHNYSDTANVKALMGEVYQRQGKIELARINFQAALKNFRETDSQVKRAAVAFALGRLELNEGNYDLAENYLEESIGTTEDIRSDLSSRMLATAFSASVHDRYETYIDCLMRKHNQQPSKGLDLKAFQASELSRARSLEALLRETQTKIVTGVDPRLASQEKTLRQKILSKAEQTIALLATDYKKEQLNELEKDLTRLREEHERLSARLKQQNSAYDQIKGTTTYSVQQIQDLIIQDDETMLLEYSLGKSASYAWAITRTGARVYNLPKGDEITNAVRAVYQLLIKPPDEEIDRLLNKAAGELSQMILTPLANQPNVKRVIVVGDGALNYIPFQLLPLPSGNQAPLVANYEIVNAPSASILGQLRQEKLQRPASTRVLAAFGDPAFPSNYAQLKNSGAAVAVASTKGQSQDRGIEVDPDAPDDPARIQPLFYSKFELQNLHDIAGAGAFVARGFQASRAVLENTDFSQFAILHLATHGVLDPEDPGKSGFYLSTIDEAGHDRSGLITMKDVYNLRVPVALVVLSACRTALGQEVRGEGLIGLTRGFMHAGASSVVASLWRVDDQATAELMKYFYTNMLKEGMPPATALRAAQNTLRQHPQWQSPHYWAAFTLQGEFKEPIRLPPPSSAPPAVQNTVVGGLFLTLLGLIGWGYWRRRKGQFRIVK